MRRISLKARLQKQLHCSIDVWRWIQFLSFLLVFHLAILLTLSGFVDNISRYMNIYSYNMEIIQ
jgi:hypothetical protein